MIALRLLECLQDRESSGFYIFGDHYNVIPKRLYRSVALQDAIYLLHSTWTAYRQQQLRKTNALDLKTHCQALRSIQLAINDDQQRLAPETVAAVTILHQVEVFFNRSPAYNAATHSHGLYALLKRKGPPCIDDELDTSVTLETVAIIVSCLSLLCESESIQGRHHIADTLADESRNARSHRKLSRNTDLESCLAESSQRGLHGN